MPAPAPEPSPSFVLGSGPSLLRLSESERRFLDRQPFVFAMNKYLMYWDKVGVHPSHFFLADTHFPAYLVLQRSTQRARELSRVPKFCIHQYYAQFVNTTFSQKISALPDLARFCWRGRGAPVWFLSIRDVLYFQSGIHNDLPLHWAESLDESLYFYRGSLTVLLNLITILNPGRPIYLLGVDMNTPGSFYDKEIAAETRLHDRYRAIGEKEGVHPTVATIDKTPGILHRWDFVASSCRAAGCEIYSTNPQSLLVESGLCEYKPLPIGGAA